MAESADARSAQSNLGDEGLCLAEHLLVLGMLCYRFLRDLFGHSNQLFQGLKWDWGRQVDWISLMG